MDARKRQIEAYRKAMDKSPMAGEDAPKGPKGEGIPASSCGMKSKAPSSNVNPTSDSPTHLNRQGKASRAAEGLLKVSGKENPYRKAAKLLLLIGKEEGARVLRHFKEEEVEKISREIAQIQRVDPLEAEQLLKEFGFFRKKASYPAGGIEAARAILTKAFGEELGRSILNRSVPLEEQKLFSFLRDWDASQLHQLLRSETPAVVAVLFPFLRPEQASQLLERFEPEFRTQLLIRLARKDKVSREVLERMEQALKEKARALSTPSPEVEIDGKGKLAEILKYMDVRQEQSILERLEEEAPRVAEDLKERLFTIDVLEDMEDRDLQKVLRTFTEKDIALILKGKTDRIRMKILSNLSERRRLLVSEEYRYLGAVPKKEVEDATRDFLNTLKRMEQEGSIVIHRPGETVY